MRALDDAVKAAGITVLNEVGVDPGLDHMYAIKTINEVHEKGGKVCTVSNLIKTSVVTIGYSIGPRILFLLWRLTSPRVRS